MGEWEPAPAELIGVLMLAFTYLQQGPFLVAGGTRASLLAEIGDQHLVSAVGAADSSKTFFQHMKSIWSELRHLEGC